MRGGGKETWENPKNLYFHASLLFQRLNRAVRGADVDEDERIVRGAEVAVGVVDRQGTGPGGPCVLVRGDGVGGVHGGGIDDEAGVVVDEERCPRVDVSLCGDVRQVGERLIGIDEGIGAGVDVPVGGAFGIGERGVRGEVEGRGIEPRRRPPIFRADVAVFDFGFVHVCHVPRVVRGVGGGECS